MNNLKVGKKFLVIFSSIIVCTTIALIVLICGLNNTANRYTYFYTKNYMVVSSIGDMRARLQASLKSMALASLESTAAAIEEQLTEADTYYNFYVEKKNWVMQNYEGDLSMMRDIDNIIQSMEDKKERIYQLCRANAGAVSSVSQEAQTLLADEYAPALQKAALTLQAFAEQVSDEVDTNYENTMKMERSFMGISIFVSVIAILIAIVLAVYLTRGIVVPIKEVQLAMENITKGDLRVTLTHKSRDELGMLQDSVRKMSEFLNNVISDEKFILSALGNGDFQADTTIGEENYVGVYHSLLQSIRDVRDTLSSTLAQINESSDQVAIGANQVSAGAQALSQGATEQASSVQELAATISEISSAINHNAESAKEASDKSNSVKDRAAEGSKQMEEMLAAMGEISDSSNEIGKIVKTIEDIAFQTNILALNAAVEAARVGVAGKGFAVVADEVRNLASKSADASKDTSILIERSLRAVEHGSKIANETAASLGEIVGGIDEVTSAVDQISNASNAQATSAGQISQGIDQISAVVQNNSATAEQSAAASEELSGQAQMLKNLVGQFKLMEDHSEKSTFIPPEINNDFPVSTFSAPAAPIGGKY
jgi:methyl-accepting chemotaxis protein